MLSFNAVYVDVIALFNAVYVDVIALFNAVYVDVIALFNAVVAVFIPVHTPPLVIGEVEVEPDDGTTSLNEAVSRCIV